MLFLIYLTCFADRSNIGVAMPAMREDLGISSGEAGALLSAFFWGYALTQIPGGWLASRIGAQKVVVGAMIAVGLAGCATGMVTSMPGLIAARFLMGLAEGFVWPSFAVLFLNWFPADERGRAVGLSNYAIPLSSVVMAPLAGWMINSFDWRSMFILQGLPAIVLALLLLKFSSDKPESDRRLSEDERRYIIETRAGEEVEKTRGSFRDVLKLPVVWGFSLTYFLWVTGLYSVSFWMPTLLKQISFGIDMNAIGLLTAVPYVFATAAMYLVSRASDRYQLPRGWYVAGALFTAAIGLTAQYLLRDSLALCMMTLIVAGIGIYASMGAWWSWLLSTLPRDQAGPAVGLVNLCGNMGGILGPILVGLAAGNASFGLCIIGFAVFGAAVSASMLAALDKRPVSVNLQRQFVH